jgi:hypothetical protein
MKNPAWMPGESPQVAQFPRKIILLHRIFTGDAKEASEIRCELNPRATFFFKSPNLSPIVLRSTPVSGFGRFRNYPFTTPFFPIDE